MRLPGSEKLEIIRLVEQSHLPARIIRCGEAEPVRVKMTSAQAINLAEQLLRAAAES